MQRLRRELLQCWYNFLGKEPPTHVAYLCARSITVWVRAMVPGTVSRVAFIWARNSFGSGSFAIACRPILMTVFGDVIKQPLQKKLSGATDKSLARLATQWADTLSQEIGRMVNESQSVVTAKIVTLEELLLPPAIA